MATLKNPKADLRKSYHKTFEISLIISLVILIAAFKFSPVKIQQKLILVGPPGWITVEDVAKTVQKPDIPPPPKAPQPVEPTSNDLEEIEFNESVLKENEYIEPPPPPRNISEEIPIFVWSEVMPEPIGGLKTLQEKVHYTEIARKAGIEGTVYIQAKIDKNGDVVEAIVLKGLGGGLDEEALNAVKSTKFHPGEQRGRPVNVKMVIPIKFVLR
jgi:protein TonB